MEELKLLVQMVASLPTLAIWVVVAFYAYKISIIGSVYGVIRFVALKLHDWAITKKAEIILPPRVQEIHFADIFLGVTITADETMANLTRQIKRLQGIKTNSTYIHKADVDWLREAIDAKLDIEKKELKAS